MAFMFSSKPNMFATIPEAAAPIAKPICWVVGTDEDEISCSEEEAPVIIRRTIKLHIIPNPAPWQIAQKIIHHNESPDMENENPIKPTVINMLPDLIIIPSLLSLAPEIKTAVIHQLTDSKATI